MPKTKLLNMAFSELYPYYIAKAERKERTKAEVDTIISWLTGYTYEELFSLLQTDLSVQLFFEQAPKMNPNRELIKGVICGIRVEDIENDLMQNIRYLDKLIDELAKGKSMDKILRNPI